jgi:hypothetical protein
MEKEHASDLKILKNLPSANAECQPANVHPTQKIQKYTRISPTHFSA